MEQDHACCRLFLCNGSGLRPFWKKVPCTSSITVHWFWGSHTQGKNRLMCQKRAFSWRKDELRRQARRDSKAKTFWERKSCHGGEEPGGDGEREPEPSFQNWFWVFFFTLNYIFLAKGVSTEVMLVKVRTCCHYHGATCHSPPPPPPNKRWGVMVGWGCSFLTFVQHAGQLFHAKLTLGPEEGWSSPVSTRLVAVAVDMPKSEDFFFVLCWKPPRHAQMHVHRLLSFTFSVRSFAFLSDCIVALFVSSDQ